MDSHILSRRFRRYRLAETSGRTTDISYKHYPCTTVLLRNDRNRMLRYGILGIINAALSKLREEQALPSKQSTLIPLSRETTESMQSIQFQSQPTKFAYISLRKVPEYQVTNHRRNLPGEGSNLRRVYI